MSWVGVCDVGVLRAPLNTIRLEESKPVPFTVSVNAGEFCTVTIGFKELRFPELGLSVTVAEDDLVESAWLVAVTVTRNVDSRLLGAT